MIVEHIRCAARMPRAMGMPIAAACAAPRDALGLPEGGRASLRWLELSGAAACEAILCVGTIEVQRVLWRGRRRLRPGGRPSGSPP